jgi:hypothetical protein
LRALIASTIDRENLGVTTRATIDLMTDCDLQNMSAQIVDVDN